MEHEAASRVTDVDAYERTYRKLDPETQVRVHGEVSEMLADEPAGGDRGELKAQHEAITAVLEL